MKTYVNVNSSAERMCLKLEALEVAKIPISQLKLLAVQVEVRIIVPTARQSVPLGRNGNDDHLYFPRL